MRTQAQWIASWRSLLGGAEALIRMGGENERQMALRHIHQVQCDMLLAQIFGLPADEASDDPE